MIRSGDDKYIPQLKKLWIHCFPADTESFIDFYFRKIYRNEETLIWLEGEKPVASFQMIPYPLKNNGQIRLAGYISGAMTHPDFRAKGIMSRLLNHSFDVMREKGYDFSFLIPQKEWLFDYYERFGYQKAFPVTSTKTCHPRQCFESGILRDKAIRIHTDASGLDLADFFIVYSRFLIEENPVVLKSKDQVSAFIDNFFDEKGVLFANDWGIAFCIKESKRVIIKEFFYFDPEIESLFLSAIENYFQTQELLMQNYSASESAHYRGMIKNLNGLSEIPIDIYMSMMLD